MGQNTSLDISSEDSVDLQAEKDEQEKEQQEKEKEQEKQPLKSNKARKVSSVNYKEVASCIQELNEVTTGFADRTGKQLRFIIRKGTDNSIFWKRTIKIYCQKINVNTKVIESSRQLSLRQFLKLHDEITGYISALSKKYEEFMANQNAKQEQKASIQAQGFNASPKKVELRMQKKAKECCACLERFACLLLSCNHEFCEICIDSWIRDDEHSNCPLCKSESESGVDPAMVQPRKSDNKDYKSEVRDYLMRLADRSKRPRY